MNPFFKWLIFILVLLIPGVGIATSTFPWLKEKLGLSTLVDQVFAQDAAKLALNEAEEWLNQQCTKPVGVNRCPHPPCLVWEKSALPKNLAAENNTWWQTQGRVYSKKIDGVKIQPRYIIEEYQFLPDELNLDALSAQKGYSYYRITAKASGKSEKSQSILESIHSVNFN